MIKKLFKILWKLIVSLLAVIGALTLTVFLLFWGTYGNVIQTVGSIERVEGTNLYLMDYHGDYKLDLYLQSNVSSASDLLNFFVEELMPNVPAKLDLSQYGCTTFVAETENGHPLMGRNFDMADTPAMLIRTNPKDGYKSISMASLLFVGYGNDNLPETFMEKLGTIGSVYLPVDGVNEKGLAVSIMMLYEPAIDQQTEKADITIATASRLLLDRAATVEEAVELLSQYDMHSTTSVAYHFLIADAQGNSAVVEYINNEMVVLWDQQVCTNFLLAPQDLTRGLGLERYWTAREGLDETGGVLNSQEAMALLKDCRWAENTGSNSSTQWSCVYDLKSRSVDIVMNEDWDNVLTFKLSKLPF